MPNQHTITVPISAATERQLLTTILARLSDIDARTTDIEAHMTGISDTLTTLRAAVGVETSDLAEKITVLEARVADLAVESPGDKQDALYAVGDVRASVENIEALALDPDPTTSEEGPLDDARNT